MVGLPNFQIERCNMPLLFFQLSDHDALEHSLYLEVEGNHYGGYHGSLFRHRRQIKVLRPTLSIRVDTNRRTYSPGSRGKQGRGT